MSRRPAGRRGLASAMGADVNAIGDGLLPTTGRGVREKSRAAKAGWKVGDTTRGRINQSFVDAEGVEVAAVIPGGDRGVWAVNAQGKGLGAFGIDELYITGRFSEDTRGSETAIAPATFLGPGSSGSPVTVHAVIGSEDTPFTGTVLIDISALRMGS